MMKLMGLFVFLLLLYGALLLSDPNASSLENHYNLGRRIGTFGILSLAAGLLIITGGIDLSLGSVVGLSATSLALLLEPLGKLAEVIQKRDVGPEALAAYLQMNPDMWQESLVRDHPGLAAWLLA